MKHDWQPIEYMDGMKCSACKEVAQCEDEWPRSNDTCPGSPPDGAEFAAWKAALQNTSASEQSK